jgi:hypothetical protein
VDGQELTRPEEILKSTIAAAATAAGVMVTAGLSPAVAFANDDVADTDWATRGFHINNLLGSSYQLQLVDRLADKTRDAAGPDIDSEIVSINDNPGLYWHEYQLNYVPFRLVTANLKYNIIKDGNTVGSVQTHMRVDGINGLPWVMCGDEVSPPGGPKFKCGPHMPTWFSSYPSADIQVIDVWIDKS